MQRGPAIGQTVDRRGDRQPRDDFRERHAAEQAAGRGRRPAEPHVVRRQPREHQRVCAGRDAEEQREPPCARRTRRPRIRYRRRPGGKRVAIAAGQRPGQRGERRRQRPACKRGEPAAARRGKWCDDAREHRTAHDRRRVDTHCPADTGCEMRLHEAGQQRLHHRDPDARAARTREQQPRMLRTDARRASQPDQRDTEPHAARDPGEALQAPRAQCAEPHQQDRDRRQQAGRAVADPRRALDHVEQRADRGERRPQVQPDEHDRGEPPSGGSEAIHCKALSIGTRLPARRRAFFR
ncbi:Uncharacterised protein [Burkholderia cenocepacia]|nr:Uncharacterised protein [Burkholderia cenocepacia]